VNAVHGRVGPYPARSASGSKANRRSSEGYYTTGWICQAEGETTMTKIKVGCVP
jgi:hypothetical protein